MIEPRREFDITPEHLSQLGSVWEWGVRLHEPCPNPDFPGTLDDGVWWADDEEDARDYAKKSGFLLVRRQRVEWLGEWQDVSAVEGVVL